MAELILFVFDEHHRLMDRRKYASSIFFQRAKELVPGWNRFFNFYAFDKGTSLDNVQGTNKVIATSLAVTEVQNQIKKLLEPGAQTQKLGFAMMPKIEARWIGMDSAIYCPVVKELKEATLDERISLITTALEQASRYNCRIFVGPEEMLFNGSYRDKKPFNESEKEQLERKFAGLTKDKMLLLIPGTIYWQDKSGGVHNSISAFAGGQVIGSYDKKNWTGVEESAANPFGKPVKGTLPYANFHWNGLQVGCQICQDSADQLNPKPDIHIVAGSNAGLVAERHRDGGVFVYADAIGMGRATDSFRKQSFDKSQAMNPAVLTLAWP